MIFNNINPFPEDPNSPKNIKGHRVFTIRESKLPQELKDKLDFDLSIKAADEDMIKMQEWGINELKGMLLIKKKTN